ncbi:hypothetical protein Plhal304r1_c019g0067421 [Plasmopara halstedii]
MLPERLYEGRGDAMRSKEERSRRFRILCFGDSARSEGWHTHSRLLSCVNKRYCCVSCIEKAWAMVSAKKAVPKRRAFTGSP